MRYDLEGVAKAAEDCDAVRELQSFIETSCKEVRASDLGLNGWFAGLARAFPSALGSASAQKSSKRSGSVRPCPSISWVRVGKRGLAVTCFLGSRVIIGCLVHLHVAMRRKMTPELQIHLQAKCLDNLRVDMSRRLQIGSRHGLRDECGLQGVPEAAACG